MRSRAEITESQGQAQAESLYDRDFALWIEAQVAAVRAGDVAALDVDNLIGEIRGLDQARRAGARLAAQGIMAHL